MSTDSGLARRSPREFVGFVWLDDWTQRIGVLVDAADLDEATATVRSAYGDDVHVSIWNETDASAARRPMRVISLRAGGKRGPNRMGAPHGP